MKASTLRTLALLTALLIGAGFALVFFYAPNEADQGFIQKIFYLHVPLAIVALGGFVVGGDPRDPPPAHRRPGPRRPLLRLDPHVGDLRRRRPAHRRDLGEGLVGALVGLGRADAGQLPDRLPALRTYYPLRYAIEDRERQARYASVFAITAGAFVPLNFMAVRAAESLVHPRTFAHRRRRPARRHVARLPRLLRRHRGALGARSSASS